MFAAAEGMGFAKFGHVGRHSGTGTDQGHRLRVSNFAQRGGGKAYGIDMVLAETFAVALDVPADTRMGDVQDFLDRVESIIIAVGKARGWAFSNRLHFNGTGGAVHSAALGSETKSLAYLCVPAPRPDASSVSSPCPKLTLVRDWQASS